MIFDGKAIDQITDAEIAVLVTGHVAERRHVEFKLTVNHQDNADRLETLLDICSLANGGGGYIFIGIRDDGKGRAQTFADPGDTARIARSIRDLCLEHIEPRVDDLEVRERTVDGHRVVVVRVPVSARTPHMVTYQEGTHLWSRYEDGKRAMTAAEVRAAFTADLLNRRLSTIEQALGGLAGPAAGSGRRAELLQRVRAEEPRARLAVRSGEDLSRGAGEAFQARIGERAAFYVSATPNDLNPRAVDVDREDIQRLFRHAPDSYPHGWIVTNGFAQIERFDEGIRYHGFDLGIGVLELLTNGYLDYSSLLGESFYWKQSPEEIARRPRLWPIAIIEYPLSFLKLFRALVDLCGLRAPFHVDLRYHNISGHILPPGVPTDFGFLRGHEAVPYPHGVFEARETVPQQFEPDATTYVLIQDLYASFRYGRDAIPFWSAERQRFHFPGR